MELYHLKPQGVLYVNIIMLCETESSIPRAERVKKGEARRAEQKYKWPERSVGNGILSDWLLRERSEVSGKSSIIYNITIHRRNSWSIEWSSIIPALWTLAGVPCSCLITIVLSGFIERCDSFFQDPWWGTTLAKDSHRLLIYFNHSRSLLSLERFLPGTLC